MSLFATNVSKLNRACFTLVEILIVFAIIGVIGGILAIKVDKAYTEQRFKTEVAQLVDHLRLAQNLMIIFNANVKVKIWTSQSGDKAFYQLTSETILPKGWSQELHKIHELKTICNISYDEIKDLNEPVDSAREMVKRLDSHVSEQLTLNFLSNGAVMDKLILRLASSQQNDPRSFVRWIALPGYPAKIESSIEQPTKQDEGSFIQQLTQETHEIAKGVRAA